MTDHKDVYKNKTFEYDLLVSKEDYEGNLLKSIKEIRDITYIDIVDLGAGTGRITSLLATYARHITAFDISEEMLRIAGSKIYGLNTIVADHRFVPLKDKVAHMVISGWAVSYLVAWCDGDWHKEIDMALNEMKRLLFHGGVLIIIESLGTGYETPRPPNEKLKNYYSYLEEKGFSKKWIRTDYKFSSSEEADRLVRNFFGNTLADTIVKNNMYILPECTGLWWLNV
jgi:ubiquinone/menaquinone biosynthesis C-methylase UbiE